MIARKSLKLPRTVEVSQTHPKVLLLVFKDVLQILPIEILGKYEAVFKQKVNTDKSSIFLAQTPLRNLRRRA